ncbi:MAG: hypothetical protein ABWZ98_07490 [Nakamurella sp.]
MSSAGLAARSASKSNASFGPTMVRSQPASFSKGLPQILGLELPVTWGFDVRADSQRADSQHTTPAHRTAK